MKAVLASLLAIFAASANGHYENNRTIVVQDLSRYAARNLADPLEFRAINELLSGRDFGPDPGPCTTSQPCSMTPAALPKEYDIYITARAKVDKWIVFYHYQCDRSGTHKISQWVTSGTIELSKTIMRNLYLDTFAIVNPSSSPSGVQFKIDMPLFSFNVQTDLTYKNNVNINLYELSECTFDCMDGLRTSSSTRVFYINGQSSKAELEVRMIPEGNGRDLSTDLPYEFRVVANTCQTTVPSNAITFQTDLGLNYVWKGGFVCGILVPIFASIFTGLVKDIMVQVLSGTVGATVCSGLEGMFKNGVSDGPANLLYKEFYAKIYNYVNPGTSNLAKIKTKEDNFLTGHSPQSEVTESLIFKDNEYFNFVRAGLNDFLRGASDTPDYRGRMRIVELIDKILENDSGSINVVDVTKPFKYVTLDPNLFRSSATSGIFNAEISLTGYRFTGLNSLKKNFAVADKVDTLSRTLYSYFYFNEITAQADIKLRLSEGTWVNNKDGRSKEFTFTVGLSGKDLFLQAYTTALWKWVLGGRYLGHLFDYAEGEFFGAFYCFLETFTEVDIPSLQLSGDFSSSNIVLLNFGGGLTQTIESVFDLFKASFAGFLKNRLPAVSENFFGVEIASYLNDYIDEHRTQCKEYTPKTEILYVDFDTNSVVDVVNTALNKVVGGNPINESSLDINSLMDFYIDEYKDKIVEKFELEYSLTKINEGHYRVEPSQIFRIESRDKKSYFYISDLEIENINSFTRLDFGSENRRELNALGQIGGGWYYDSYGNPKTTNPVKLSFKIGGEVCRDGECVGEKILVDLEDATIFELEFDFDLYTRLFAELDRNRVMGTTFDQAQILSCLITAFDDLHFEELTLNTTKFKPTVYPAEGAWTNSLMGKALTQLQVELENASVYTITTNQARYIVQRLAGKFVGFFRDSVALNIGKIDKSKCTTTELQFDTAEFDAIFNLKLPNGTQFETQPIISSWPYLNETSSIVVAPAKLWENNVIEQIDQNDKRGFDIRDNTIVEYLRDYVNSNGLVDPIRSLANTTFFKEYLAVREDGSVDIDLNLAEMEFFAPITNDYLIEGFKVAFGRFTLEKIENAEFFLFQEYDPDARFTTKHRARFNETLNATLTLFIETDGPFVGDPKYQIAREEVKIDFVIQDLALDVITFLAVDLDELEALEIDTFVQVDENQVFQLRPDTRNCILKAVFLEGVGVPGFQITYSKIEKVRVSPLNGNKAESKLFTDGAALVFGAALDAISEVYKDQISDITQGPVRKAINDYLLELLADSKNGDRCPQAPDVQLEGEKQYLNIRHSDQVMELYKFADENFLNPDSAFYVNSYVKALFVSAIEGLSFSVKKLPLSLDDEEIGNIGISIDNVDINNLETFDQFKILDWRPVDGKYPGEMENYTTRTAFATGAGSANVELTMDVTMKIDNFFEEDRSGLALTDDGKAARVQNDLRIKLSFSYLELTMDLVTRMKISNLLRVKIQAFFDLVQYPCLLEAFPDNGLQILDFGLGFGSVRAQMTCIGTCNSKKLDFMQNGNPVENEDLNKAITDSVNQTIKLLNVYLKSSDFADSISNEIDNSANNCIRLTDPVDVVVPETVTVAKYMGVVGLSGLFAAFVAFAFLVPVHMKRRDTVMKSALLKSAAKGGAEQAEFVFQERKISSSFKHPAVPFIWRYLIPVMIVINIIFFFTANFLAIGAAVQLKIGFLGDLSKPMRIMEFTLETSIDDMWNAGTYFLSLAIALLSGFWPYVKNIMLLFCWFAPATVLPAKKRGGLLDILDALGKWSLVDVYVLVMLTVAFRFYVSSSYVGGVDNLFVSDAMTVDVVVVPGWGIYGFCFGAIGSLIVNHLMIHFNTNAERSDEEFEDKLLGAFVAETPTNRVSALRYRFAAADASGRVYGFGPGTKLSIGALLVLSFLLITIGSFLDLITFEFLGITGVVLNLIDKDLTSVTYSLTGIATAIVRGSDPDALTRLGILFIQVVYLMFAMIVPIFMVIVFGILWFVPLRLREQRKLLFVSKILGAWEALIVLVASVIASVFQISQLAQFIVQHSTGTICTSIQNFLLNRKVSETDSRCFDVTAHLEGSGVVLIVGSVLLVVLAFLMFRLVDAIVEDRYLMNKKKDCINPKSPSGRFEIGRKVVALSTVPVARINLNGMNQVGFAEPSDDNSSDGRSSKNPLFFGGGDIDV